MKKALYLTLFVILSLSTGCSSQKSYEPAMAYSAPEAISEHGRDSAKVSRSGVTFSNGQFVTKKGEGKVRLPKGFYYVNQSSKYILAASESAEILIINATNRRVIKKGKLSFPLVSGAIHGDNIIYMLQNDVFGVYSISQGRSSIDAKVGQAYAIDTRVCNPMVLAGGKLMAVPTLDGKLLLINPKNPKGAQSIGIGSKGMFNNVIFLSHLGNRIIAATPKKLVSAMRGSNHKYDANIADVVMSGSMIYLLTQDGWIVKLTPTLQVVARKKFQFAQFLSIAVVSGKVYAIDKQGSLIVTDSSLERSKTYSVGEVEDYTFVSGSRLYIDDKVIQLSKLPL